MSAAVRYLTIPAEVDAAAIAREGVTATTVAFWRFVVDVVLRHVPWGTADQQECLDALCRGLREPAGSVVELREADHAALAAAMAAARRDLPGDVFLTFAPFFGAVARATTTRGST